MSPRLFLLLAATCTALGADTVPLGTDGKPLNLGFEDGTLRDWKATGDAWSNQPIKGDAVYERKPSMRSEHAGTYWIGGYEGGSLDRPTGTLTSAPFKVTQPWASFLVGGGNLPGTRVEIVSVHDSKVIHTARGIRRENMMRSVVDLRPLQDREIFIRLVDEERGGWGHINFDDFVFHSEPPKVDALVQSSENLAPDTLLHAGLKPEEVAKAATLPDGFELKVFAAEPDLVNPIAFCIDERGRLWVVEGRTYPKCAPEGEGQDRILLFEDSDGDGKADKRTVFMERLNLVSGIEIGFGGVWVGAAPYLMFIPIADGDSPRPAGEPRILLDGWGYQDTHETLNTFRWGPDGWLYGCHGVFTHSAVGKPGTPDDARIKLNAGYWRYHPTRHEFEVFAEGTSNPWGIDFDQHGQLFAEACVIPHLFHVIQGARYHRQAGQHFNPNTYGDIKTIADHRHYLGDRPHGGNGRSASAGGGHAHAGLMIYQGDVWPEEWRGRILMNNIHGARINADQPVREGSGFIGKHGPDFINFNDRASQVVDIRQGPGSAAYLIDWYDLNQCHRTQREAHDYTTGRIYKVTYRGQKEDAPNLGARSNADLLALTQSSDAWASRQASRLLQERAQARGIDAAPLRETLRTGDPLAALRALWTLRRVGALSEADLLEQMVERNGSEYVTAWSIQFACETSPSAAIREQLALLAQKANSPVVQLYLASAAQRLPIDQRAPLIEPLVASADPDDHNLPLMLWYAIEPMVGANPLAGSELLPKVRIPMVQEFIARRMASTAQR